MKYDDDRACWKCKHCDLESASNIDIAICRRPEADGTGRTDLCDVERSWRFPVDWFVKSCGERGRYFESIMEVDFKEWEPYNESESREREPQE